MLSYQLNRWLGTRTILLAQEEGHQPTQEELVKQAEMEKNHHR